MLKEKFNLAIVTLGKAGGICLLAGSLLLIMGIANRAISASGSSYALFLPIILQEGESIPPQATATATPDSAPTMTPTATPESAPTMTPTATATATPESAPTMTPTATATATPESAPTMTPTATATATPESAPTMTPTATATLEPPVQGQGILFISDRQALETYDLYRMEADGSNVQRLTELAIESTRNFNHTFLPRWSPDGTQIVFQVEGTLYLMQADGSNLQILLNDPQLRVQSVPQWSPNGNKLAYIVFTCIDPPDCDSWGSNGSGLQVFDLTTDDTMMIVEDLFLKDLVGVHWTPDNASIVVAPDTQGVLGLYIAYLDGSAHDHILHTYSVNRLALAPDGDKLAISVSQGVLAYTADIDGSNISLFHDGTASSEFAYALDWHPTQQRLAYAVATNSGFDHTIYTNNLDGTPRFEVTSYDNASRKRLLGWTSDGTQLIYMSDVNRDTWAYDIYRVNDSGSSPFNLTLDSPASDIATDYFP